MTATWVRPIEAAFEQQFGLRGVRGQVSLAIPHQAHLTLFVPGVPSPAMAALAQAIEAEYAELDRSLLIRVVSAGTG